MLDAVEALTSAHRRKRARHYLVRSARLGREGAEARQLGSRGILPDERGQVGRYGGMRSLWHWQRYLGQCERFERVRNCGDVRMMLEAFSKQTGELLTTRPFETKCGNWRVCADCLAGRKFRLKRGVLDVRERALRRYRWQLRPMYRGAEGRWSERLWTLTVPHSGCPGDDARMLASAWREFSRRLRAHLEIDRKMSVRDAGAWVRSLEVTPSDRGHAHLHVWWVGPFVDHVWARVTWGRVLESLGARCPHRAWSDVMVDGWVDDNGNKRGLRDTRVRTWCRTRRGVHGRQPESVPWPHVHIREVAGSSGAAEYATKVGVALYVVKSTGVEHMHPLHAAAVYQALEGSRCVQWARGWAPKHVPDKLYRLRTATDKERADWVSSAENRRNNTG